MTTSRSVVSSVALQDEIFAANHFSAANEENLHAGFPVRAGHRNHIRIDPFGRDHALVLHHPFDRQNLVADGGSPLEIKVFGRRFPSQNAGVRRLSPSYLPGTGTGHRSSAGNLPD